MPTPGEILNKKLAASANWDRDLERREDTGKVLNAYYGGRDWKTDFVADVLRLTFKDEQKLDRPLMKLDVVQRFGDELATVFDDPPDLQVHVPNAAGDLEVSDEETELLSQIMERARWFDRLRTAEIHNVLCGTTHLWPRRADGQLKLEVISPAASFVVQDDLDPQKAQGIAYRRSQQIDSPHAANVQNEKWVWWGRELHFTFELQRHSDRIKRISPQVDNPYRFDGDIGGVIPVKVDFVEPRDDHYWAEPATSVLLVENAVNVWIMAMGEGIINQGFTITHSTGFPEALFKTGRHPGAHYVVENPREGEAAPSMGSLQLTVDVESFVRGIEYAVQQEAVLKGLPPSAFRIDQESESGFSKMVSRITSMKDSQAARSRWASALSQTFEATKRVWNVEQERADAKMPLELEGVFSEDAVLVTEWPQSEVTETPTERVARWESELKLGTMSPVDVLMEKHPDMDRPTALDRWRQIQQESADLNASAVLDRIGLGQDFGGGSEERGGA